MEVKAFPVFHLYVRLKLHAKNRLLSSVFFFVCLFCFVLIVSFFVLWCSFIDFLSAFSVNETHVLS